VNEWNRNERHSETAFKELAAGYSDFVKSGSVLGIVAFSTNDQGEILIVGFEGTIYKLNLEDTAFE
jgi:hypothetical protein